MSPSLVRLERDGAVFVLHMCHGENLVNLAFLEAMSDALDEVERRAGNAALVITGHDRFYSTGFDRAALAQPQVAADIVERAVRLCGRLMAMRVPTCAAINGHAFGIGAMIALSLDFRVMREDRGYLCLPELELKLPLHPGMFALLKMTIERQLLHEMLLTGARVGARRALAHRVIDETASEEHLLPCAVEGIRPLAKRRGPLLESYKRSLNAAALEVIERGTEFVFPPVRY